MDTKKKDLLTPEVVDALDSMLRRLAMQKVVNGHLKMDFEDVVSELWINALKTIERVGKVDFNYLAKASFNKMVDLTRHNISHEATPIPNEKFSRMIPNELRSQESHVPGTKKSDSYIFSTSKFESVESHMDTLGILELFEEDSKEYKFVEAWMRILGIIESENYEELPEKAYDGYIAVNILGYAGSKSNGYGRIKRRVQEVLRNAGYRII